MSEEPTVIQANHYEQARQRFMKDPIVIAMAEELKDWPMRSEGLMHDNGNPTFKLMQLANKEYSRRGGKDDAHIGAVAEAILRLLKQ